MAYPVGASGISTLRTSAHWHADLFEVTRSNGGVPLRLSGLDREIWFEGHRFFPTAGDRLDADLAPSTGRGDTELVGAISPQTITSVDIMRGTYDDAEVRHLTIDWRRPEKGPYVEQYWYVDELIQDGYLWRATMSTSARFMEAARGDIYHATCPAVLGDDRCRAVVVPVSGTVQDVIDSQLEFETDLVIGTNLLRLGSIEWLTGNNRQTKTRVLANIVTDGLVQLAVPTRFPIRIGDTFDARQGCDGTAIVCRTIFNNLPNFRGNERQRNEKQIILNRGTV